jgi:hypothetical protein
MPLAEWTLQTFRIEFIISIFLPEKEVDGDISKTQDCHPEAYEPRNMMQCVGCCTGASLDIACSVPDKVI